MSQIRAWIDKGEQSGKVLASFKLANSALILIWGFAATYVFAAKLEQVEFSNFVLLMALANFTIAAEFGISNIVYDRLRRWRLRAEAAFTFVEIGVIVVAMAAVIVLATLTIGLLISLGIIRTQLVVLFLGVFLVAALNMVIQLVKRMAAAVDRNILFDGIDIARRMACLALLLAALIGFDLTLSIYTQLVITLLEIGLGFTLISRAMREPVVRWFDLRGGTMIIRSAYGRLLGPSVLLTIVDIAAYNAPFLIIAALTDALHPLLLYDLLFKLLRAVGILARVGSESTIPRITRAAHEGRIKDMKAPVLRGIAFTMAGALSIAAVLMMYGPWIADRLYHGKLAATQGDFIWITVALVAMPVAAGSMSLNGSFARFDRMLLPALVLLMVSSLSAPLAALIAPDNWSRLFIAMFASGLVATALIHVHRLGQLISAGGTRR